MIISRTVRKNQDNLYISIPREAVSILDIKDDDVIEIKIIKIHRKK